MSATQGQVQTSVKQSLGNEQTYNIQAHQEEDITKRFMEIVKAGKTKEALKKIQDLLNSNSGNTYLDLMVRDEENWGNIIHWVIYNGFYEVFPLLLEMRIDRGQKKVFSEKTIGSWLNADYDIEQLAKNNSKECLEVLQRRKQYDDIIMGLKNIKNDPDKNKKLDSAIKSLDEMLKKPEVRYKDFAHVAFPRHADILMAKGKFYKQKITVDDEKKAKECFEQALLKYQDLGLDGLGFKNQYFSSKSYFNLALLFAEQPNYIKALNCFERLLKQKLRYSAAQAKAQNNLVFYSSRQKELQEKIAQETTIIHLASAVLSEQVYPAYRRESLKDNPLIHLGLTAKYIAEYPSVNEKSTADYFGVAYEVTLPSKKKIILIAHCGTETIRSSDLAANLLLIMDMPHTQFAIAHHFVKEVVAAHKGVEIYHCGHSLGAILAETMTFENDGHKAVTFESPGSRALIQRSYTARCKRNHIEIDLKNLYADLESRIICYLMAPNFINTLKPHSGKRYRLYSPLFPNAEENIKTISEDEVRKLVEKDNVKKAPQDDAPNLLAVVFITLKLLQEIHEIEQQTTKGQNQHDSIVFLIGRFTKDNFIPFAIMVASWYMGAFVRDTPLNLAEAVNQVLEIMKRYAPYITLSGSAVSLKLYNAGIADAYKNKLEAMLKEKLMANFVGKIKKLPLLDQMISITSRDIKLHSIKHIKDEFEQRFINKESVTRKEVNDWPRGVPQYLTMATCMLEHGIFDPDIMTQPAQPAQNKSSLHFQYLQERRAIYYEVKPLSAAGGAPPAAGAEAGAAVAAAAGAILPDLPSLRSKL